MKRRSFLATLALPLHAQSILKLQTGFVFIEGPAFNKQGDLYFSDVGEERIYCLERGQLRVVRNSSNLANGLAFDKRGRLIVCERGRLTRTEANGRFTILADSSQGKGLHWPNDVVVAADSSIYFTDLKQKNEWANPAKTGINAIYHWSERNGLSLFANDCESPNGITLSPKQDRLYVSDTTAREIKVYDLTAKGQQKGMRFTATSKSGGPDGIKTDSTGNLWVCEDEGLIVFNPLGERLTTIEIPESPSNCAFTPNGATLVVTAKTSIYELKLIRLPNTHSPNLNSNPD